MKKKLSIVLAGILFLAGLSFRFVLVAVSAGGKSVE